MKKNIKKFTLATFAYVIPYISFAQGLVPCSGVDCDFSHIGIMINNIIRFLIVNVYPVVFTISLVWAGILFLTANGNQNRISKARSILKVLVYGLIIMLTAWIIVYTILNTLGVQSALT